MVEIWHKLTPDDMPDPLKWCIYITNDRTIWEGYLDEGDVGYYKKNVKWWIYPPDGYEP